MALSGVTAFVGANGDDGMGNNAGAAYQYDIKMQRVYFDFAEYYATEGDNADVTITISRDADYTGHALTVAYATSDVTAKGIDSLRYTSAKIQLFRHAKAAETMCRQQVRLHLQPVTPP